jgi:PHD/YefM family antitoxin component YafN of YafNO toxin-antitoxin module
MSEEELESLEETAEILAIPGAKEAIDRGVEQAKKGEVRPLEEILKNIE